MNVKNFSFKTVKKSSAITSLLSLCLMISYLPVVTSCQSKELSRAQAQKMITGSQEYKDVTTVDYINRTLRESNNKGTSIAKSSDEPEPIAIQNRISAYFQEEPRVGIANHLGLVKAELKRINEKPEVLSSRTPSGFWYFDENYTLTDKAKTYWRDYGLPAQESVIPTAKKEFIEVTGITKTSATEAEVEFSWQWMPNELGKSLDPSTEEFKRLPEELKTNLTNVYPYPVSPFISNWGDRRTGAARFRKYDDGWRMVAVVF